MHCGSRADGSAELICQLRVTANASQSKQQQQHGRACRKEKRERVNGVISALGLDKCQNTLVGGAMRRGVSGGERKRVSVGHELLISPSIIILDEPTSGLDSTTAMSLVQTLKQLARDGRSIITTIHQPSSRLFQQLDRLMLMSSGELMYSGLGREVGEWFAHFDCKLPYGWNIADYILDVANGEFQDSEPVLGVRGRERKVKLIEVRFSGLVSLVDSSA